ncbi:MAG: aminotransferase class V-fold PLP-dependent enzyme, partial [bacterium]
MIAAAAKPLDVAVLRRDFPILSRQVHGKPLVYLDNAATTQKPRAMLDALLGFYERSNANIHRGVHALSEEATAAYEGARERVARFVGAPDARGVVFTRNATEAINLVASGWARPRLQAGDEIVVTLLEHHSNFVPWIEAARVTGAPLKHARLAPDGPLDLAYMRSLIGP